MLKRSIITYDGLPISSGGAHRLRASSPQTALQQIREFLAHCADTPILTHSFVEVMRGERFPPSFSLPLIDQLTAKLGRSDLRHAGAEHISHRWTIRAVEIDEYVALVQQTFPLPIDRLGLRPLVVGACYTFQLVDPRTGVALSDQDPEMYGCFSPSPGYTLGISELYARISDRSSLSLFLNFPFEEPGDAFQATASYIQNHLPFQLSTRHRKQWRLAKMGAGYIGKRIVVRHTGRNP